MAGNSFHQLQSPMKLDGGESQTLISSQWRGRAPTVGQFREGNKVSHWFYCLHKVNSPGYYEYHLYKSNRTTAAISGTGITTPHPIILKWKWKCCAHYIQSFSDLQWGEEERGGKERKEERKSGFELWKRTGLKEYWYCPCNTTKRIFSITHAWTSRKVIKRKKCGKTRENLVHKGV